MSRPLNQLTPYLALGAAASVPLVVSTSEHFGFGSKQLSKLASTCLASTPLALPAASACLQRLAAMLKEASEALSRVGVQQSGPGPAQQGVSPAPSPQPSAAAILATTHKIAHPARAFGPLAVAPPALQQAHPSAAAQRPMLPAPPGLHEQEEAETAEELVDATLSPATTRPVDRSVGACSRPASAQALASRSRATNKEVGQHVSHVGCEKQPAAAALAALHPAETAAMRQLLGRSVESLAPVHFSDAELMRYAITKGFLRARTPEQRRQALEQGAAAAVRTASWLGVHPFASERELDSVSHLLRWEDECDAGGHPVLRIAIGRAVNECRGPAALAFANCIITQLQRAVEGRLGDEPGRPDRIVVVMDCSGCSALGATRIASVFKAVCASLNHHYPGRLHELVLLDLPPILTWLVNGVKQLMHPDTRDKVRVLRQQQGQQAGRYAGASPVVMAAVAEE